MARTAKPIPKKAREAWERGDEPAAEKLSGLRSRQLRNRLGPPGRGAGPSAGSQASAATLPATQPQKLVHVAPRATATPSEPDHSPPPPPPSEPEPTVEQIAQLDTREEAEAIYRDVRAKMKLADEVRYGALAEKALAALNRIEAIDKRRPAPPAPDLVQEAIRGRMGTCVEKLLRSTRERAQKLERDRATLLDGLDIGPATAEKLRQRVDAMLGGAAS